MISLISDQKRNKGSRAAIRSAWAMIAVAGVFAAGTGAQKLSKAVATMKISVRTGSTTGRTTMPDLVWDQKTKSWVQRTMYAAQYDINSTPDRTTIQPRMQYLSLLAAGGPIDPISYIWVPFEWGFPNLVLEVSNKGKEPLKLTSAVFTIQQSVLDPTPIPVIRPDTYRNNARHFELTNEGWGEIGDGEADFNLLPLKSDRSADQYNPPFTHTVKIASVSDGMNVDVSPAFAKEGLDLNKLPSPELPGLSGSISDDDPMFGKFKGGGARLVGQLRYKAATADGRTEPHAVKFSVEVWLYNEFRVGVPRPPSYDYEAKFQVTGTNYTETVPINKTIGPGAKELISIRLGAPKSSVHEFDVSLRSADARIDSVPIHLEMFIPKSGAHYIQGR